MARKRFNPYNESRAIEREWNRTKPQRDSALAAQRDSIHADTMRRLTDNLHRKVAMEKAAREKKVPAKKFKVYAPKKKLEPKTKYGQAVKGMGGLIRMTKGDVQ